MNRWLMLLTLIPALLSGCATGTTLATGNSRPPTNPQQITLYTAPPPGTYDILGMVDAKTRGHHQASLDRATNELKKQAAKLGANGILLSGAPQRNDKAFLGLGDWTRVSGQAVFVTGPAK
ncbi:MAG: hypothetical protein HYZ36_02365 [Pedosphaera parvula]|nr:hypothetical protein [Pedosphaera parvula]